MIHDSKDNRDLFFALGFFVGMEYFFWTLSGTVADWTTIIRPAAIAFIAGCAFFFIGSRTWEKKTAIAALVFVFLAQALTIWLRAPEAMRSVLHTLSFLLLIGFLLGHISMVRYQANLLKIDSVGGTMKIGRTIAIVLALGVTLFVYKELNAYEQSLGTITDAALFPKTLAVITDVNTGIKQVMKKESTVLDEPITAFLALLPTDVTSMLGLSNVDPAVLNSPQVRSMIAKTKKDMEKQVLSSAYEIFGVPEKDQSPKLQGTQLISYRLSAMVAANYTFFKIELTILCLFALATLLQLGFGVLAFVSAILFIIFTKLGLYEIKLGMIEKQFLE